MSSEGYRKPLRERIRETVRYHQMQAARRSLVGGKPAPAATPVAGSFLILPADVGDPTGSRGDEAMIQAVIDRIREARGDVPVAVATRGGGLAEALTAQGITELPIWGEPWRLDQVWRQASAYDAAIVIGADVLDGYYSSVTSLRLWMVAELFATLKGPGHAVVGGFSFNARVTWPVRRFLDGEVSPDLAINVRDPISYRRFTAAARPAAEPVADLAFMLRPRSGPAIEAAEQWVAGQQDAGHVVCGLNIHPMLSPRRDPAALAALVQSFASAARDLIDGRNCSMLLIPHDFRGDRHGDVALLTALAAAIDRPDRVMLQQSPTSAAEIKQLAGKLDCVFTGRMHLAIAALGSGCPVVGITYQDKFDGLFLEHFALDPIHLVKAADAADPSVLMRALTHCIDRRDEHRARIGGRLPHVMMLSRRNLAPLLGQSANDG